MKKAQKQTRRKPYSKPEVQCVRLTPEETLSTNCKVNDLPGGGPANINDCLTDGCYEFGS